MRKVQAKTPHVLDVQKSAGVRILYGFLYGKRRDMYAKVRDMYGYALGYVQSTYRVRILYGFCTYSKFSLDS